LIVEDTRGYVFGAYLSEDWKYRFGFELGQNVASPEVVNVFCSKRGDRYYGTGETFLFSLKPKFELFTWTKASNLDSIRHLLPSSNILNPH